LMQGTSYAEVERLFLAAIERSKSGLIEYKGDASIRRMLSKENMFVGDAALALGRPSDAKRFFEESRQVVRQMIEEKRDDDDASDILKLVEQRLEHLPEGAK